MSSQLTFVWAKKIIISSEDTEEDETPATYLVSVLQYFSFSLFFLFFVFVFVFRAVPMAYRSSQARGPIRAAAAGLHHRHSNARSEMYLRPTPQLMATLDP